MPLPDVIEIEPMRAPVRAAVTVPGSKSITNRALVLAALAPGEVTLTGALWSEDTQAMVDCLRRLAFEVQVRNEPAGSGNVSLQVGGRGGVIPHGGTEAAPLELHVGNAGTVARFLSALVCLGRGVYRLSGVERMHERPQAELFQALRSLGYRIDSDSDRLPAVIYGTGPRGGNCRVSIQESSQFASALLLCAKTGGWDVSVAGDNSEESPYVAMTRELIKRFEHAPSEFQVEPDASSGSYFWGADWMLWSRGLNPRLGDIIVQHWPESGWQIDAQYPRLRLETHPISRRLHLGDSIMTAIVLAAMRTPRAVGEPRVSQRFEDLGRLRLQECERVRALRMELERCGAEVRETGDTLEIFPGRLLHGAEIETYGDHRMAMCFSILGLNVPGIRIKNPACVKKTFPGFFQKLAAQPPGGLGVVIRDARLGAVLTLPGLAAD
jgi:3-phosphoshikimate 1-carboxyvinyltransferase